LPVFPADLSIRRARRASVADAAAISFSWLPPTSFAVSARPRCAQSALCGAYAMQP
jgi:hypothetical protein